MINSCYSIKIGSEVAKISSEFEQNNGDLKRRYFIKNIQLYNSIAAKVTGTCGSFGTGYPFYALTKDLNGQLPVIKEQIRYNSELASEVEKSKYTTWSCAACLTQNYSIMPDLKQICKPCPNMDDALKPRKIINRLPDLDMWLVCDDYYIESAKKQLIELFRANNLQSSDINPIQTIFDISEINDDLKENRMPNKPLPLDAHIIDYSTFYSLIEQVPFVLKRAAINNEIPYLPIHPLSYRKKWQYDDVAYNFIHDYLSSLTEFNFKEDLKQILYETRNIVAKCYSIEQLYYYLLATGPECVRRRHKTLVLEDRFKERINLWRI